MGDTAYGDGDTRVAVEQVGVKVTAKTQPPVANGRFRNKDIVVDPHGPSAPCPAGHTTRSSRGTQYRRIEDARPREGPIPREP